MSKLDYYKNEIEEADNWVNDKFLSLVVSPLYVHVPIVKQQAIVNDVSDIPKFISYELAVFKYQKDENGIYEYKFIGFQD